MNINEPRPATSSAFPLHLPRSVCGVSVALRGTAVARKEVRMGRNSKANREQAGDRSDRRQWSAAVWARYYALTAPVHNALVEEFQRVQAEAYAAGL